MSSPTSPSVDEEKQLERAPFADQKNQDEGRLRRKIDLYLLPILCLTYISAFIDRIAIGNARVAGIETDLELTGYDYNTAVSLFFVSYILFEIPGILLCRKVGPHRFLPICTIMFGIFSLCTAFVKNFPQLCGTRFLLGFAEAPMLPGISYYLSRFYRKDELVFRLGLYIVCAPLGGAFGGLLASAILKIDNIGTLTTWQQIFLVEGLATVLIGAVAYLLLPKDPGTASWLTEGERKLAAHRVASEQVGIEEPQSHYSTKHVLKGACETQTVFLAAQFLLNNITVQGVAIFTPTIVATIFPDVNSVRKNLFTVPPYMAGAASTLLMPYLSMRYKKRGVFLGVEGLLMIIGYAMFVGSGDANVRYGASFVTMIGAFPYCSIVNAWISANSVSDFGRAVSIGTIAMFGNIGGLISTWSYLPNDAPDYHNGNSLNLGTSSAILVLVVTTLIWMRKQNAIKDAVKGSGDKESGAVSTKSGREHPDYRYRY